MKTTLSVWGFCLLVSPSLLAGVADLRLSIQPDKAKEGRYNLIIENTGDSPASYFGYGGEGSTQPMFKTEVKKGEEWVDRSLGWCGNGMGACNLKGKEKISTSFYGLPQDENGILFRVNISVSASDATHWDQKSASQVYSLVYKWTNGKIEQAGADQPAIKPGSKPKVEEKPERGAEKRSR